MTRLPARARGDERRARVRIAVVLLVAVGALGLLLWMSRGEPGRSAAPAEPPPEPTRARTSSRGGTPDVAASASGRPQNARAAASDDWDPSSPPGTDHGKPTSPDAAFPYPPGSQPLTEAVDPMTQQKEDDTVDAESGIRCIFGPRVAVVHPPDALVIDLEVKNKLGARLPITGATARFRGEKSTFEQGPWYAVPLSDDGSGKDVAALDLSYTATFKPTADQQAALFKDGAHVFVEVSFEAPNQLGKRRYSTAMEYSRMPRAKLSGIYSDAAEAGSLVVQAGVTAEVAGDYRVIGSLFGPGGTEAIAFASKSMHLEAGEGRVPLLFFGKILRDKDIDGPYELRNVMLFEELLGSDVIPGVAVDHAYTTKAYRARDFSGESYVEPAPAFEQVDMNHPSQKDKPPPLFSEQDRAKAAGTAAPIKADPPGKSPAVTFHPGTPGYGK